METSRRDSMKAYKIKHNLVIEVECEELKYPLKDSEEDTIYENTHFDTKKDAYKANIANCKAGISILTRQIKDARDKVREFEVKLADECLDLERLIHELEIIQND
jgi:hypothetical protein